MEERPESIKKSEDKTKNIFPSHMVENIKKIRMEKIHTHNCKQRTRREWWEKSRDKCKKREWSMEPGGRRDGKR